MAAEKLKDRCLFSTELKLFYLFKKSIKTSKSRKIGIPFAFHYQMPHQNRLKNWILKLNKDLGCVVTVFEKCLFYDYYYKYEILR